MSLCRPSPSILTPGTSAGRHQRSETHFGLMEADDEDVTAQHPASERRDDATGRS